MDVLNLEPAFYRGGVARSPGWICGGQRGTKMSIVRGLQFPSIFLIPPIFHIHKPSYYRRYVVSILKASFNNQKINNISSNPHSLPHGPQYIGTPLIQQVTFPNILKSYNRCRFLGMREITWQIKLFYQSYDAV